MRHDGRAANQLRPLKITRGFTRTAPGSVLIEAGGTRVLCTASIENKVPEWMVGKGRGWLTAEYNMLPGSTTPRKKRERDGKVDGRTTEIQRLIGRSLRAIADLDALGERSIVVDCDVLEADGGTRTASITGAFVALVDAIASIDALKTQSLGVRAQVASVANALRGVPEPNVIPERHAGTFPTGNDPTLQASSSSRVPAEGNPAARYPLTHSVAAISVGLVDGVPVLDLDYKEDFAASVDMNVVMTGDGRFVEVQGTGEEATFSADELNALVALARGGIEQLAAMQRAALGERWPWPQSVKA